MRLKQIRGLPVIDPTAARKIGTVVDYQVDPTAGRIAALDIEAVDNRGGERILAHRVRRVGGSAVILTARGGSTPGTTLDTNDRWLDLSTLSGLELMGDDGNRIGHLLDATFDQDTLGIEAYLLRASLLQRLLGRRGRIQPNSVHSCSRELMMVTTGRLKETEPAAASEATGPIEDGVPLKHADRVSAPEFETVPDGQSVAAGQP